MLVGAFELQPLAPDSPRFQLAFREGRRCPVDLPSQPMVGTDDATHYIFVRHTGPIGFSCL